ncbi:MAG: TetR/AcrR family transcriptional regulator [Mycobacterium sp.]
MTRAQLGRPVGASGEETRQRIIVATMRCVAKVGYARATIREIARTANVTSASLYNYFPNKSELIKAAIAARTDVALPRLREAAGRPGDAIDRIDAVLDESGQLMREYPDLAAFEWVIRAESVVTLDSRLAGSSGFEAFREIIESIVDDAYHQGDLANRPDRQSVAEAIYALIYGLTELAATLPSEDYHAALGSAKQLIRGTLFGQSTRAPPLAGE